MGEILPALGYFLALGLRHATDPDHVLAVSTMVARSRTGRAWILGAAWGLGHAATVLFVGVALLCLKSAIPERGEALLEGLVGVMLVGLGLANLGGWSLSRLGLPVHSHAHLHDDPEHAHVMEHGAQAHAHPHVHLIEPPGAGALGSGALRASAVGLVHGLAGSAAVALLAAAAVGDALRGAAALAVFGAGTLVGMAVLAGLMERALKGAVERWLGADRWLTAGTGLLSLAYGVWILYRARAAF